MKNIMGRPIAAQYLNMAQTTARDPSLKILLVKNIGTSTAALGIFSMIGSWIRCFLSRYFSIWYLRRQSKDSAREASCMLEGARSFLLRMMKTVSRNWKVDSYDPSIIVIQFVTFSISGPGLKSAPR